MIRRSPFNTNTLLFVASSVSSSSFRHSSSSSSSSNNKDAAFDQLMSAFKKKERNQTQQQQRVGSQQTTSSPSNNNPSNTKTASNTPNNNNNNQRRQNETSANNRPQHQHQHQRQQQQTGNSADNNNKNITSAERHQQNQKIKNLEQKLSQMTNDEFAAKHLDNLMRTNISKIQTWVIHVTLNEAEKRIAVLSPKGLRDTLLLSASGRHGDRQSVLQLQQQQQQSNNIKDDASSSNTNNLSSTTTFTSRCVSIFLQRSKTHSRDPTFGLIDAVVDSAYQNESFEELISLANVGADKLLFTPDDYPTDVALFRVLWRVVCLGVKKSLAVRHETKMLSKSFLSGNSSNNSTNNNNSDSLKSKLKELHQKQHQIEAEWRNAAEEVWKHMMRCNTQLHQNNNNNIQQERSQLFTAIHRFVLYGSSKHQQQSSTANNNSSSASGQKDDFSSSDSSSSSNNSSSLLDWGEMHSFHLWYEKKLFLSSKTQPLQLYLSLIRTCRSGLWLEQAQLYFENYQASKNKSLVSDENSDNKHNNTENKSNNLENNNNGAIEEILIFTLLSVFQHGKDYKRICSLGRNLIQSAAAASMPMMNSSNINDNNENENDQESNSNSDTFSSSSSPQSSLLSATKENLTLYPVDSISASVLATVAQSAGETYDSLLVNQCLTLILRKFIRAAHFSGNDRFHQNADHPFPSTFTLYQGLSAAAKSGASGFPALAEFCINKGWVTASENNNNNNSKKKRNNNNKKVVDEAEAKREQEESINSSSENDINKNDDSSFAGNANEDEDDELLLMMREPISAANKNRRTNTPPSNNADDKNTNSTDKKNKTDNDADNDSSLFDAEKDVRLHLLLQWANSCSNIHQEGTSLISRLEAEVKAAKKRAISTFDNDDQNNNNRNKQQQQAMMINSEISSVLSERCHNQVLQLIHRIEHPDYLRWYRLGRSLGYFRQQWIEMLVLWADRRRYALSDDERKYILSEFRSSGVSESGLRPMLALLKFDYEERPLERFKKEFRNSSKNNMTMLLLQSPSPKTKLPSSFIESNPSVLDPRAYFLRKGSFKVAELKKSFSRNNNNNTSSLSSSPRAVTTCDKGLVSLLSSSVDVGGSSIRSSGNNIDIFSSSSSSSTSSSIFQGPPTLHSNFSSSVVSAKSSSSSNTTKNDDNVGASKNTMIRNDPLLLQWFLCSTVEGMQMFGNGFGIEDIMSNNSNDQSGENSNNNNSSEQQLLIPYRRQVEKAEQRLLKMNQEQQSNY